eukprot:g1947.t1
MKQLRGQSGALIVLEQRDQMRHDQHRRHVTIKGTPAQIATAKILIAERVSRDVLTNRSASLGGSGGGIDGAFETSTMVGASESGAFGDERAADDGRYDRRLSPPLIPATPARRVNSEDPPSVLNFADLKIGQCRDDGEDVDSPDGDILPNTPSLGVDVGGVLLAYGPDGSRGFSRRRSTIDGGLLVSPGPSDSTATAKSKHKPMHPIVSEDDLLIDIRVADEVAGNAGESIPASGAPAAAKAESDANGGQTWNIPCHADSYRPETKEGEEKGRGCYPASTCLRVMIDDFADVAEVERLRDIAFEGMRFSANPTKATRGGPTIMDINSGFVRDPYGIRNMYEETTSSDRPAFTSEDFALYERIVERVRAQVKESFGIDRLYFTAPTFVTREVGSLENNWTPRSVHDEYYHAHVDKNNTEHYHYSGLLYLADYEEDFTGGMFAFLDGFVQDGYEQERPCFDDDIRKAGAPHDCQEYAREGYCASHPSVAEACPRSCGTCAPKGSFSVAKEAAEWRHMLMTRNRSSAHRRTAHEIEPARGRLVIFSAGQENLHQVRQVATGTRLVLSLWFTCDETRRFDAFLDGEAHRHFRPVETEL